MHLYVIVCKHECMCVYVCRYLTMNNIFIYVGMYVFRYVNMFFGIILYIASFWTCLKNAIYGWLEMTDGWLEMTDGWQDLTDRWRHDIWMTWFDRWMSWYCIVSLFISKTWLTKCSHLQDMWTKLKQKYYCWRVCNVLAWDDRYLTWQMDDLTWQMDDFTWQMDVLTWQIDDLTWQMTNGWLDMTGGWVDMTDGWLHMTDGWLDMTGGRLDMADENTQLIGFTLLSFRCSILEVWKRRTAAVDGNSGCRTLSVTSQLNGL